MWDYSASQYFYPSTGFTNLIISDKTLLMPMALSGQLWIFISKYIQRCFGIR